MKRETGGLVVVVNKTSPVLGLIARRRPDELSAHTAPAATIGGPEPPEIVHATSMRSPAVSSATIEPSHGRNTRDPILVAVPNAREQTCWVAIAPPTCPRFPRSSR